MFWNPQDLLFIMGSEIFEIDASWAEKLRKTRVPFIMNPTVYHLPLSRENSGVGSRMPGSYCQWPEGGHWAGGRAAGARWGHGSALVSVLISDVQQDTSRHLPCQWWVRAQSGTLYGLNSIFCNVVISYHVMCYEHKTSRIFKLTSNYAIMSLCYSYVII